jgi:hypothetical protein
MRGAIPPLSQYVFMAGCLVKHRDNFTFTLPYTDMNPFCEYTEEAFYNLGEDTTLLKRL